MCRCPETAGTWARTRDEWWRGGEVWRAAAPRRAIRRVQMVPAFREASTDDAAYTGAQSFSERRQRGRTGHHQHHHSDFQTRDSTKKRQEPNKKSRKRFSRMAFGPLLMRYKMVNIPNHSPPIPVFIQPDLTEKRFFADQSIGLLTES